MKANGQMQRSEGSRKVGPLYLLGEMSFFVLSQMSIAVANRRFAKIHTLSIRFLLVLYECPSETA